MKKYLLLICFLVSTSTLLKAQTGTGIIAQINSPYTFTPTTVDSTTTIPVQFMLTSEFLRLRQLKRDPGN